MQKNEIQKNRKRRILVISILILSILAMQLFAAGCTADGGKEEKAAGALSEGKEGREETEETQILVFIAASLNSAMTEIADRYNEVHPEVEIIYHADSSGTLMTQIKEGYECDIFFSAAKAQMDRLMEDGFIREGTCTDVLSNQLVLVAGKDNGTPVKGLETLRKAESIALAGGSVPAGRYTRQALVNLGILKQAEDVSAITAREVAEALGGTEISEQDNVSKVLASVAEGSCEVGTVYYSDTCGYEDKIDLLEKVSTGLTGDVVYPAARVINEEADEAQNAAADDFLKFIRSDEAKEVFGSYYFGTDVD